MNSFWRDVWDNYVAILFWPYRTARAIFYALLDGSDGSNLNNSGLFEQGTDITTPFTDTTTATGWGSGATGYYGGSTGYWPPTTLPPPDIQNKPKPLEIPDLDAPRVINLD
jgi:hypothetical protein